MYTILNIITIWEIYNIYKQLGTKNADIYKSIRFEKKRQRDSSTK